MNYYAIGIGGSGAKCIEALTHLCAAGLMPDGELYVLFVDPDKANGNVKRAGDTVKLYDKTKLQYGDIPFLKTSITTADPSLWSPFEQLNVKLGDFFNRSVMETKNPAAAHLFDVLYTKEEMDTVLDNGFRGRPSIGAAVLAATVDLKNTEPWKTFYEKLQLDIKNGSGSRIFLFGSIFGGTGASGFPTIARLIRDGIKDIASNDKNGNAADINAGIGGALLLPYFSFRFKGTESKDIRAKAEDFLLNSQAGLQHYYKNLSGIFDAIYAMGDNVLSLVSNDGSPGGDTQENPAHIIELYAALAAVDFFSKSNHKPVKLIARENETTINWRDLEMNNFSAFMGQLTRFAFSYLQPYYSMLNDINNNGGGHRAPWYIDFFEREDIILKDTADSLDSLRNYCKAFLLWMAAIHASANEKNINLIKWKTFAENVKGENEEKIIRLLEGFDIKEFARLVLPNETEDQDGLHRLWERLCSSRINDAQAKGLGKFVTALYRENSTV